MSSRSPFVIPAVIALVACVTAGCGRLPTQPTADVAVAPDATIERGDASVARSGAVRLPVLNTGNVGSARLQGKLGGTVRGGQFTVVVSPGAFKGNATVTVSQPDPNDPRVDLSIWPATKNGFDAPVTLIADLPGATPSQLAASQVREWDPATGVWLSMSGSSVDVPSRKVHAPLVHFSSYRVDMPASTTGGGLHTPFGGR